MTQPSEFEQVVETLQLTTWQSDILSIAHNASIAVAERRVLERLKARIGTVPADVDNYDGVLRGSLAERQDVLDIINSELAALSGQGPAKPCPKCGMPDPDHTPDDPRHMSDEEWAKMSKPAPHVEHFIDVAQRVVAEKPTNPCKTYSGSGIDPEHPHQSKMCRCIKPPCVACGGTGVAK